MGHHRQHHGQGGDHAPKPGGEDDSQSAAVPRTERDKLIRMLEYWLHHNEDHALSYAAWADRAESLGENEVRSLLREMASDARRQNEKLKAVIRRLGEQGFLPR